MLVYIHVFLFLFFVSYIEGAKVYAQELKVMDCYVVPNDKSALENPRKDSNDNLCALLRIKTDNIKGLKFTNPNQYVGNVEYKDGVYMVYIPTMLYKLSFGHEDYQPGIIDMSEFGYKKNITGGKTYEIIIETPKNTATGNFVSFKISPYVAGCKVVFDGEVKELPANGLIDFPCSPGIYRYRIEANMYESETGTVTVTSGAVPINKVLRPSTIAVNVSCNTKATIYIDNVNYGSTGIVNLPQGMHNIRIVAPGYIDYEETLQITPSTENLQFVLNKNKKQVDVHPVYVTVLCHTSKLYKNNKVIEGWRYGIPIKMMPNTSCRLSDDEGKGAVLRVGDSDMEVVLSGNEIIYMNKNKEDNDTKNDSK